MRREWTIDTNVLHRASGVDMDAVKFIVSVLTQQYRVTFDDKGHIKAEYRLCLKKAERERRGGRVLVGKWFREVVAKLGQTFCGRLDEKHKRAFKKVGFDEDDWPFVAVCAKTQSRELVTEDSDYYKDGVIRYLQSEMGINVMSIKDALEK